MSDKQALMHEITVKLSLDETNLVLEALGNLPFARVYGLVAKIQGQAGEQLRPRETPATEVKPSASPVART